MRPSVRSTRFPLNTLTAAVLAGLAGLAQGLPQGGQVTVGSGSIDASGSDLTVNQDSAKLVIDWQSFGVASGERVQFLQPDASAVALNRVLGNNASEIYGQLTANGQVFLTNPNGILFGSSAQVDVGGMVASTLTLSNADFLAGHYVFSGAGGGTVTNQGRLTAADGGVIALLAPTVRNEGLIAAPAGAIGIGAGRRILLDMANGLRLEVEESALNAVIENHQAIRAEGGTILLTASAQQALLAGMINNTGVIEASSVSDSGGVIRLVGGFQSLGGSIDAGGTRGGTIEARGHDINQFGRLAAEGRAGAGGRVDLVADAIVQPDSASISADGAGAGGTVYVQGHDSVFTSGALSANGGQQGGAIVMRGNALTLAAATLSATGANAGGRIRIGGDFQGQGTGQRASSTWINAFSTLDASATQNGDGGSVVVWSDSTTAFAGTAAARGGAQGGNGGRIEISSGDTLQFAGLGDAGAANGAAGTLLLDPKNIFITDAAMPALQVVPLPDPTPTQGDQHGSGQTQDLGNGTLAQASPDDDFGGTNAGAVYVYRQSDGALLSMLTGSHADDRVGSEGIITLANGNFLVNIPNWDNGSAQDAGAVAFVNAGVNGVVSSSNALVGGSAFDQVGSSGVSVLKSGNYLVQSAEWDNGAATDAGAVTGGNGDTGITGVVSAGNSLVGTHADDRVGDSVFFLSNGNYLVRSPDWDNGALIDAGAVTFGNSLSGIAGAVSASNSLVGGTAFDHVGGEEVDYADDPIVELANGNYVVSSSQWDNGTAENAGAATWGSGTSGVSGVVSAANSLVGTQTNDRVSGPNLFTGVGGIIPLANGNYLVSSSEWDNGSVQDAGAVTFSNGMTGISGAVSAGNSLVGSHPFDNIGITGGILGGNGSFVQLTTNSNYVLVNPGWDNGSATDAGAVTWGSGTSGVSGVVGAGNSLVGSHTDDLLGFDGVTALANGNYLVRSLDWDNGALTDAGAVSFGNGDGGSAGVVDAGNSLVGSHVNDHVGSGGILELANGNYVVSSPDWDNGSATNAGAATWGSGTSGVSGTIDAANSLVGGSSDDQVGGGSAFRYPGEDNDDRVAGRIYALPNGNYVVASPLWDNGNAADAGAVTFGNGETGTSGVVDAGNSLVGTHASDFIGGTLVGEFGDERYSGVVVLSNGNYVVRGTDWDNGSAVDAGAATWGSGVSGVSGEVSSSNSLVGTTTGDRIGDFGIVPLSNGNYLVRSVDWDNGGVQDAGAVTFGNGTTGISGAVSAGNSLVGSHPFDNIGLHGITELANGNYVVRSLAWDNGAASDAGAVTWGSGTSGVSGEVSAANSLVGSSMGDRVGEDGIVTLANGNYLVRTPFWDNGSAANAGAVTFGNGATGTAGVVSPGNSLVGSHPADLVGLEEVTLLANGNYVVASPAWHNGSLAGAGAVTWGSGTSGVSGEVSAANSLVGSHAGDMVGFFDPDSNPGVVALSNGNYVVASSFWDNGSATDAGAVTFGNGASGVSGVVSASNSLVGSHTDDRVGGLLENLETGQSAPSIVELANGNYAVISPLWDNGSAADAGAVTLANGTTGIMGPVSSFNSLVGTRSNDSIGLDGLLALNNGDLLVRSPNYHDGTGRVDILRLVPDGGAALTGNLLFGDGPDADVTLTPGQIAAILNTGTNLTLQANTDITLNASADIVVNNPDGNGGDFTLQAGRSININSDIITDNGDLTLRANEYPSRGVVTAERDPGAAQLAVVSGVTLDAGNGNVNLTVAGANYGNDSQLLVSDGLIRGAGVRLLNQARNGDIVLEPGAQLLATGSGLPLLVGTTNGGDLFSADGAAPAQTPDGFWLAFEVKPSRFNFAFGDIDGIIRRGSRSR